jgi:hypothetical protein
MQVMQACTSVGLGGGYVCVRACACVFVVRYGLNLREVSVDVYMEARRIWSPHLSP